MPVSWLVHLVRTPQPSMYGGEVERLWLSLEIQKLHRVRIKITDDRPRFEVAAVTPPSRPAVTSATLQVPLLIPSDEVRPDLTDIEVTFSNSPVFGLAITRLGEHVRCHLELSVFLLQEVHQRDPPGHGAARADLQ